MVYKPTSRPISQQSAKYRIFLLLSLHTSPTVTVSLFVPREEIGDRRSQSRGPEAGEGVGTSGAEGRPLQLPLPARVSGETHVTDVRRGFLA